MMTRGGGRRWVVACFVVATAGHALQPLPLVGSGLVPGRWCGAAVPVRGDRCSGADAWQRRRRRRWVAVAAAEEEAAPEPVGDADANEAQLPAPEGFLELTPSDLERAEASALQLELERRATLMERSGGGEAGALVQMLMQDSPREMLNDFFSTASPDVAEAMKDAVTGLLGGLPRELQSEYRTTTERLMALSTMLQTTGYMFRNAEYVLTLLELLDIRSRSAQQYRAAFDRIDTDGDGSISTGEVVDLLTSFYEGEEPPHFEVESFMRFFDRNFDGKISWDEFSQALCLGTDDRPSLPPALGAAPEPVNSGGPKLRVEGKINVKLEDGREISMDANDYLDGLKKEAAALREALAEAQMSSPSSKPMKKMTMSEYVSSLPPTQREVLTAGIEPRTAEAMKRLAIWIFSDDDYLGAMKQPNGELVLEKNQLGMLCLWQLALGYKLRDAEAKDESRKLLG